MAGQRSASRQSEEILCSMLSIADDEITNVMAELPSVVEDLSSPRGVVETPVLCVRSTSPGAPCDESAAPATREKTVDDAVSTWMSPPTERKATRKKDRKDKAGKAKANKEKPAKEKPSKEKPTKEKPSKDAKKAAKKSTRKERKSTRRAKQEITKVSSMLAMESPRSDSEAGEGTEAAVGDRSDVASEDSASVSDTVVQATDDEGEAGGGSHLDGKKGQGRKKRGFFGGRKKDSAGGSTDAFVITIDGGRDASSDAVADTGDDVDDVEASPGSDEQAARMAAEAEAAAKVAAAELARQEAKARVAARPLTDVSKVSPEDVQRYIVTQCVARRLLACRVVAALRKEHMPRKRVAMEILETERSYVNSLRELDEVFYQPLCEEAQSERPFIVLAELRQIFSNLQVMQGLNSMLLDKLEKRVGVHWHCRQTVGDIFMELVHFLKVYTSYINSYSPAIELLTQCMSTRHRFAKFLHGQRCHMSNPSLSLTDLLIMPVQRIPRYQLLLKELLKHTDTEHPDYTPLSSALKAVTEVAEFVNESKRSLEKANEIMHIQSSLVGPLASKVPLVDSHRRLVRTGTVQTLGEAYDQTLYLFNDMALFVTPQPVKKKDVTPLYATCLIWLAHCYPIESACVLHERPCIKLRYKRMKPRVVGMTKDEHYDEEVVFTFPETALEWDADAGEHHPTVQSWIDSLNSEMHQCKATLSVVQADSMAAKELVHEEILLAAKEERQWTKKDVAKAEVNTALEMWAGTDVETVKRKAKARKKVWASKKRKAKLRNMLSSPLAKSKEATSPQSTRLSLEEDTHSLSSSPTVPSVLSSSGVLPRLPKPPLPKPPRRATLTGSATSLTSSSGSGRLPRVPKPPPAPRTPPSSRHATVTTPAPPPKPGLRKAGLAHSRRRSLSMPLTPDATRMRSESSSHSGADRPKLPPVPPVAAPPALPSPPRSHAAAKQRPPPPSMPLPSRPDPRSSRGGAGPGPAPVRQSARMARPQASPSKVWDGHRSWHPNHTSPSKVTRNRGPAPTQRPLRPTVAKPAPSRMSVQPPNKPLPPLAASKTAVAHKRGRKGVSPKWGRGGQKKQARGPGRGGQKQGMGAAKKKGFKKGFRGAKKGGSPLKKGFKRGAGVKGGRKGFSPGKRPVKKWARKRALPQLAQ